MCLACGQQSYLYSLQLLQHSMEQCCYQTAIVLSSQPATAATCYPTVLLPDANRPDMSFPHFKTCLYCTSKHVFTALQNMSLLHFKTCLYSTVESKMSILHRKRRVSNAFSMIDEQKLLLHGPLTQRSFDFEQTAHPTRPQQLTLTRLFDHWIMSDRMCFLLHACGWVRLRFLGVCVAQRLLRVVDCRSKTFLFCG